MKPKLPKIKKKKKINIPEFEKLAKKIQKGEEIKEMEIWKWKNESQSLTEIAYKVNEIIRRLNEEKE